jgi:hypothetical protein
MTTTLSLKSLLPEGLRTRLRDWLYRLTHSRVKGFSLRLNYPDRVFLEDRIFPWLLSQKDLRRVLFIGCDWYTKDYPAIFKSREFWTLEIDAEKARFGSGNHVVDSLENLSKRFTPGYFDVIIHTGVFGWGVNSREMTEQTFEECRACLKPGGLLVFGWDDVPKHCSFPVIEECEALKKFQPVEFPPLGKHQHLTAENELRHTFNFFRKPALWLAKLHLMLEGAMESAVLMFAV